MGETSLEYSKITVDAATFNDQNAYGVALIARDCTGVLLKVKTKLFPGNASLDLAKAMAIKEALRWIMRWEGQKVVI